MIQRRDVAIHASILLIATGGLFLLATLGAVEVGPRQGWPVFPALVGVLAFVQGFARGRHAPALVGTGALLVLTGAFFFAFTLPAGVPGIGKLAWRDLRSWWPAFPTIAGVAFAAAWIADGGRRGLVLVPATILTGVGLGAFAVTLGPVAELRGVGRFWPLAPTAMGIILLVRVLRTPRSEPTSHTPLALAPSDAGVPDGATFGDRA